MNIRSQESQAPTEFIVRTSREDIKPETEKEHGSGGYKRDRAWLMTNVIGPLIVAAALTTCGMIIRHEVALGSLEAKIDLLIHYFHLETKEHTL